MNAVVIGFADPSKRHAIVRCDDGRCFVVDTAIVPPPTGHRPVLTGPTLLTLLGYACSLAWLAGAPMVYGIIGVLADELDGRLARASGTDTRYGGELDYAVDVTLTGLSAVKLLGTPGLFVLPVITAVQAGLRTKGERPEFGSMRAALMLLKMAGG
jgi:hypothetical protein